MRRPFLVKRDGDAPNIERIVRMRPKELQKQYRDAFHADVPAGNSEYARRRIAWHVQAQKEGGLPESAREHALSIVRDAPVHIRTRANLEGRSAELPLQYSSTTHVVSDHDSRLPLPGSFVVRKHKGREIRVKVLNSGFEYNGRRFNSLSAIANEITGTRWNGFLFFGLTKGATRVG